MRETIKETSHQLALSQRDRMPLKSEVTALNHNQSTIIKVQMEM